MQPVHQPFQQAAPLDVGHRDHRTIIEHLFTEHDFCRTQHLSCGDRRFQILLQNQCSLQLVSLAARYCHEQSIADANIYRIHFARPDVGIAQHLVGRE